MPRLTPLRFHPLFRRYLWGGRRLGSFLHKPIGDETDYAESWEVVDHGADQSIVMAGPQAGATLADLLGTDSVELLGKHLAQTPRVSLSGTCAMRPQFPLLMKFLDAHQNLSVQVHPNDDQAERRMPPDLGKTEAWVVLHCEPRARIYAGLQRGLDRTAFEREVHRGATKPCLHQFEPAVGDCIFIPAGTVHALGAGLVVAEIQQSSDTTFRIFDWNRVGPDGQPRALHLAESLEVIDFAAGPIDPCTPRPTRNPQCERLVNCSKFVLDRWRLGASVTIGGDDGFHLIVVVGGEVQVEGDPSGEPLRFGQTMLLPASTGPTRVTATKPSIVLEMSLPDVPA